MSLKKSSPNLVLIIVMLASFVTPFTISAINVSLPSIAKELNLDAVMINWVQLSFLITAAVLLVPLGKISDVFGRKKVMLLGLAIVGFAGLWCAFAFNGVSLLVGRIVQAVGSAMLMVAGFAILTSVFPVKQRGKAIGLNVAAVYLGLSLGPLGGGVLAEFISWRSLFVVTLPLAFIAFIEL